MNNLEREHWDYEDGRQSEHQMAAFEARLQMSELAYSVKTQGQGDWQIEVWSTHYCRATDAVVGSYASSRYAFATKEEAEAKYEELSAFYFPDDEFYADDIDLRKSGKGYLNEATESIQTTEEELDDLPF